MGVRIAVHVTPRAARDEVAGWRGAELGVRVKVPPDGGRANAAACEVLARSLGVPKRAVRVVRGETSRHKQVEVEGVDEAAITAAFGGPQPGLW